MRRTETTKMMFLRAAAGYRLIDKRRDKDIREEVRILYLNTKKN
jgi:hypothetical protein